MNALTFSLFLSLSHSSKIIKKFLRPHECQYIPASMSRRKKIYRYYNALFVLTLQDRFFIRKQMFRLVVTKKTFFFFYKFQKFDNLYMYFSKLNRKISKIYRNNWLSKKVNIQNIFARATFVL